MYRAARIIIISENRIIVSMLYVSNILFTDLVKKYETLASISTGSIYVL